MVPMATRVTDEIREIGRALATHFGASADEWHYGPSGFAIKGQRDLFTLAKARKILGIKTESKPKKPIAWGGSAGEWNRFVALVNAASAGKLPKSR
jgi:hypothetical protein